MTTEADTCSTLVTPRMKSTGWADGELQFLVAVRKHLPDGLKVPPISQRGNVAQASAPASSGSVSLPRPTPAGTTGQPATGTDALREEFALSDVAEIIGKFGVADQFRNTVNQLQSLLYAA